MSGDMPCNPNRAHLTTVVSLEPSANCFALCFELPIPWDLILSRHQRIFLGNHCCPAALEFLASTHSCLASRHRWQLHCHCGDEGSLQCRAARVVLEREVQWFCQGLYFNRQCFWYRELANLEAPEEIQYVGSVVHTGSMLHFIYIKLSFPRRDQLAGVDAVSACLNPESGFLVRGVYNYWVILICRVCRARREQSSYRSCAVRVRGVIRRMTRAVRSDPRLSHLCGRTSVWEPRRQRCIRRSLNFGVCANIMNEAHPDLRQYLHL